MTVVAWDGKTLAADKQTTAAGMRATSTKLRRAANGALMGGVGDSGRNRELFAWWDAGYQKADFPDKDAKSHLLVIFKGEVWMYDGSPEPVVLEDKLRRAAQACLEAANVTILNRNAKQAEDKMALCRTNEAQAQYVFALVVARYLESINR